MVANVLAETTDMTREEWLEKRKEGIGGSDAAVICGLSKWKSPVALWLEKRGEYQPEQAGETAYWGTVLEDIVAAEFTKRSGIQVEKHEFILQHPKHPFMLANIDRKVVDENKILECKTASAYLADQWDDDKLPDAYYCQGQHYCAVTGAEGVHFAVLIGGQYFAHKYVPRDDIFIAQLIKLETEFWKKVESGERPAIDGSNASADLLKEIFPQSNGAVIALPSSAADWIKQYQQAQDELDAASFKKQEAENALKEMLGEAEAGAIGECKVEWKSSKPRATFDTKQLQKDYPEIHAKYVGQGKPSRRFSIKGGI